MTDHSFALQQSVYDTLVRDATLVSLAGDGGSPEQAQVFDHVPVGTSMPFVVVGDDTAQEAGAKDFDGQEITVTIHSWDDTHRGRKGVKDLMSAVYDALHDQAIGLTGGTLVNLRWEFANTERDPDSDTLTYHGVQRFRAYVHD